MTGGVLDVLDCGAAAAMHDDVRVVAVTVLVAVLGAGVDGWWTSERGWPAEAVAIVAGGRSRFTSELCLWVRRCRVSRSF